MKKLCLLLLATLLSAAETPSVPPPEMPAEVTLTTGRVLRNVQVVRWEHDRVILKYTGGVDPIAFSLFKIPAASELPAMRAEGLKAVVAANSPKNRAISGQVFVATRGAGSYKFGGAQLVVLPLSALDAIKASAENDVGTEKMRDNGRLYATAQGRDSAVRYRSWESAVASMTPIAKTSTDADGNYKLMINSREPVFIYCSTHRLVGADGEYNVWAVPVAKDDRIDLNNSNQL